MKFFRTTRLSYEAEDIKDLENMPKQWYIWIPLIGLLFLALWYYKHIHDENIPFLIDKHYLETYTKYDRYNWHTIKTKKGIIMTTVFSFLFLSLILLLQIFLLYFPFFSIGNSAVDISFIPLWMQIILLGIIPMSLVFENYRDLIPIVYAVYRINNRPAYNEEVMSKKSVYNGK